MRPNYTDTLPSATKGVILTATGETLATPSPNELANLFNQSPRVGLGFTKIFGSPESEGSGSGAETDPDTNTDLVTRLRVAGRGGGSGLREERRLSTTSTNSSEATDEGGGQIKPSAES
jgi:NIMA (never in mitosis gene a)-related kinase